MYLRHPAGNGAANHIRVSGVLLHHIAQEAHAEEHMTRLVAGDSGKTLLESWEPPQSFIAVQHVALPGHRQCAFGDDVVQRDALDQIKHVARLVMNPLRDFVHAFYQNFTLALAEHWPNLCQDGLNVRPVHLQGLAEEFTKESSVARFVDQLCGEKNTLLLGRHGRAIGNKGIGDAHFSLEEDHKAADPDRFAGFVNLGPLLAIDTEIEVLRTPLLPLPAMIEVHIAGEGDQFIVDLPDDDTISAYFFKFA